MLYMGFLVVFYMFLPLGESCRSSSLNLVITFVCECLVFK